MMAHLAGLIWPVRGAPDDAYSPLSPQMGAHPLDFGNWIPDDGLLV